MLVKNFLTHIQFWSTHVESMTTDNILDNYVHLDRTKCVQVQTGVCLMILVSMEFQKKFEISKGNIQIGKKNNVIKMSNFTKIFRYDAVGAMRAMEKFTQEVGGYPFLYADIFMTREEFEKMFDLTG